MKVGPATSTEAGEVPPSKLATDQTLRIAINGEPPTLDPTLAAADISVVVLRALHRGLVTLDGKGNVRPALARSWDISPDARTLTFHLRDATYSNGDPIVAGDLVYSWRRLADPRVAAPYAYVMADVVGGPELLAMVGAKPAPSDAAIERALDRLGVEAPDDHTFIVRLGRAASYFLTAVSMWVFVPLEERWITRPLATEAANYVSSGPFVLQSWVHENEIILKPNPRWWGDIKPTLSEIRMSMLTEPAQQQAAYEAGELAMVQVPIGEVQRVRSDPVLGAEYREESTQLALNFYAFNNFEDPRADSYRHRGPTWNKDFRVALTQAIDKQALVDVAYGGIGRVADSVIMPGIPGYQPDLRPYPYDLASARQHMAMALTALGVGSAADLGTLTFGYPSGHDNEPVVAFLAEAWHRAFGLRIRQIGSDFGVFLDQLHRGDFDVSWDGWGADYPHPNDQLDGLFTCGGGNNDAKYCNPAFDALIAQAAGERDPDRAVALYDQAQTLLMNDAPILPLRFAASPFEIKPYVSGLTLTSADAILPGDASLETIRILAH